MIISILVLVLLAVSSWASFVCPPDELIYPCECRPHPRQMVSCDDVFNLASVRSLLEGHFNNFIPRLYLTNVHSFSLPPQALGELVPRTFVLKNSNIRHIDRDAFEGQTSLGVLVLAEDRIEDIPTEALRRLTLLQTLSLAGNFLMRIPEQSLKGFSNLKNLVLSDNRISEIYKNAFPETLETIALSRNLLNTLNGSLSHLENLQDIYATDNRLTSVKGEFSGLSRLRTLSLDRNHIWDLSDTFAELASLTSLSLSGNRIHDVSKDLMGLEQLKFLNLSHNYLTELHWRMFEKLKDLQVLDLAGNYLKSICSTLKPLRAMRQLHLSDLGLQTLQPDCFHNMKYLTILDVSRNQLTSTEAVSRHPLPNLMYLQLNNNQLTAMKYEMKYAKRLTDLDIGYNNFHSLKMNQFASNRELEILRMEGNPWECTELMAEVLKDLEQRNVSLEGRLDC